MSKFQIVIGSIRPGRAIRIREAAAAVGEVERSGIKEEPWMPHRTSEPRCADRDAREFLRQADPVLARLIERGRISDLGRGWTSFLPLTPSRR